jgi:hypothetical protein
MRRAARGRWRAATGPDGLDSVPDESEPTKAKKSRWVVPALVTVARDASSIKVSRGEIAAVIPQTTS